MITKNMIDAGYRAYRAADEMDNYEMVESVYLAMSDQKQKDALIAYNKDKPVYGHSSR